MATGDHAGGGAASVAVRLADHAARLGVPGAALAFWHRGSLTEAATGSANIAAAIAADTATIFQVGSITKVFTATALVRLAEAGHVDLDAPVARYLPDFRIANSRPPDALTVRTLLDYSSGIAGEFFEDFGAGTDALGRYVDACGPLPLLFAPGTMRAYSSTAYCVAGRVIEVITGRPYDDALVDLVLRPLNLERYAFFHHDVARFRTAIGHRRDADGNFTAAEVLRLPHAMSASGASLTMTALDLLRFGLLHLHEGVALDGTRLLSADGIAAMAQPRRAVPPNDSELLMGWAALNSNTGRVIAASGATIEQNAVLILSPQADFALTILANTGGGAQRLLMALGVELLAEYASTVLELPTTSPAPPAVALIDAARYVGDYTNHSRAAVTAGSARELLMTMTAKEAFSPRVITQVLRLRPLGDERFAAFAAGFDAPSAVFQFLFVHGDGLASHFAVGGAVYARCDAVGATGVH